MGVKKNNPNRKARRTGQTVRTIPAATPDYLAKYVESERAAGRLFTLDDVTAHRTDAMKIGMQIVYIAFMEGARIGTSRIMRDVDPIAIDIMHDVIKMTNDVDSDYAIGKIAERLNRDKQTMARSIKEQGGKA